MGIYKNYQIKWWGFSQWFGDWFHQHFSMGNSNKRPGGLEPRGESKWDMGWYGISTARSWKFGVKKWGNTHFICLLFENNGSWTLIHHSESDDPLRRIKTGTLFSDKPTTSMWVQIRADFGACPQLFLACHRGLLGWTNPSTVSGKVAEVSLRAS